MTLEDFFTLTEIKDGLTATSRVEELLSVMQSKKDSSVKNGSDNCRQWAAVANTIAVTKNRECLDVFMRLDGLFYFNKWLIDAQLLANDSADSSVEESIFALMQAIENLGIDSVKLTFSGILDSIRNLVDYSSPRVKDLAGKLVEMAPKSSEHRNGSVHRLDKPSSGESSDQIPIENTRSRESSIENACLGKVEAASNSNEVKADNSDGTPVHDSLPVKEKDSMMVTGTEKDSYMPKVTDTKEDSRISSEGLKDMEVTDNCSSQVLAIAPKNEKNSCETSSGLSRGHDRHQKDDIEVNNDDKEQQAKSNKKKVKRKKKESSRSMTVSQRLGAIDKKRADIELGIVDALEVATKVALEVAREVDSCDGSSETGSLGSSGSISEDQGGSDSGTVAVSKETSREDLVTDLKETARKIPCDFDLNEEICGDEATPAVSVVSRPRAASGVLLPTTLLPLETTLGWTGSAATSAFRPASLQKVSSGDLKEKKVDLGIDLNVTEEEDDESEGLTPWKPFPFSSKEAEPVESNRISLDLNFTQEHDHTPPSESRLKSKFGNHNTTPSNFFSALKSMQKVNIDLNDGAQRPFNGGEQQSDEPVISILGTKVEVNRKNSVSAASSFFPNGKSLDPTLNLDIARTGNYPGLAPIYGYNGHSTPPGLSFSSPIYIPETSIPYMMDTRGSPVLMPRVIGSAPHVHQAYTPQQFFLNINNDPGPTGPNFERSSVFGVEVLGNRESPSLRQFLSPGQSGNAGGRSAETSSSGYCYMAGGKRKEPETGWETYTHNSRPQHPPWK